MAPKRPRKQSKDKGNSADLVKEQLPLLRVLTGTKSAAVRREILARSPNSIKAISSITNNLMHDKIPISKARADALKKKFSKVIYITASPKSSLIKKRQAIQKGGFLPLLAGVIPAVASLLGGLFKN